MRSRRSVARTGCRSAPTKIMVDGVAENQTAAMLTPYRDVHGHDTRNHGLSFVDPALLQGYVTALDAAGFQVHFHALGDRAVREALDALDTARAANGADRRPAPPRAPAGGRGDRDRPIRRARRRGEHPGALGHPRGPDRRAHPALPAGRRRGPAVPVRRPRAPRRTPRRRQRLARVERRPDGRDPHRGQPGRARNRCRAARRRPPAPRPRDGDGRLHVRHPPT